MQTLPEIFYLVMTEDDTVRCDTLDEAVTELDHHASPINGVLMMEKTKALVWLGTDASEDIATAWWGKWHRDYSYGDRAPEFIMDHCEAAQIVYQTEPYTGVDMGGAS